MALDPAPIGALTMDLMDLLAEEYGEQAEAVHLRAAMILVDLEVPDPEDPEEPWCHVRWQFGCEHGNWKHRRSSSAYAAGLVAQAHAGLTEGQEPPE